MAKASSKSKAIKLAAPVEKIIRKRLGDNVYGVNDESLPQVVGIHLRKMNATLAAAESCTGGLFSALITDIAGSSDYFLGGVVAYSNAVKMEKLNIDRAALEKYGAVSPEICRAMAVNVRHIFNATYGVAITGIAGSDGGSKNKPVGFIYIAVSGPKRTFVIKNLFLGDRLTNRRSAALRALDLLRLELIKE